MTPDELRKSLSSGPILPVYVVAGEELFLRDDATRRIRDAVLAGAIADFNEDKFTAGDVDVDRVLSAARTYPMMAERRLVMVRGLERWEGTSDATSAGLDKLAAYIDAPSLTTTLLLVATKLDGRRKFAARAKKLGCVVQCDPLSSDRLTEFIVTRFQGRGHAISAEVAERLAALSGTDLARLDDAIERVSLYVEPGAEITAKDIGECVTRAAAADTWGLVDAVARRDLSRSLSLFQDVYDPRDRGLPLLGALAWSVRQLARYHAARESGVDAAGAAKQAGAYAPRQARDLDARARGLRAGDIEQWLIALSETDRALKSSRRSADLILEETLVRLSKR